MKNNTAIDIFSGAGGLSQGLKQAGFDVRAAIESNEVFAESYKLNHSDTSLSISDIKDVDPQKLLEELLLEPGELDLLAGCPPCQGFSTIGTRNRGEINDPRNELVFEIVRFAKVFQPKTIMMENVPVLASDSRLAEVVKELESLGYSVDVKVLNMIHYGVPQTRKRMILLASRIGSIEVKTEERESEQVVTVRDTIGSLPSVESSNDALHNYQTRRSDHINTLISLVPVNGGSRTDLPKKYHLECHAKTSGFKDVYGRMAWDQPAPTITCGCISPSKGRFLHPQENRAITLREAALLQTFPVDYQFSFASGRSGVATMIGNALPPLFIEYHAKYLKEHIESSPKE